MNINKTVEDTKAVFAIEGRLDTVTAPELDSAIQEVIEGLKTLELNLEQLEYISSAGLRVVLKTQKAMNKQGEMIITNVKPEVMEIFEITGFVDILTIE